jgi:hypothetical protein
MTAALLFARLCIPSGIVAADAVASMLVGWRGAALSPQDDAVGTGA